ncbi:ClbS/DfsB family four-helix bundle protein [Helicobacter ganmani]|uniref:ClbS/DfsB family four-helix bundle protein n=1 Tax=Helicobacter ganmani TaxID=60246 RepID=UPI003A8AA7A2
MPRPTNKSDLLALSQKNYESLLALIEQIPLEQQSAPFEYNERDKTLRDVLVHLYEWQVLLLRFVRTNLEKTSDFVPILHSIFYSLPCNFVFFDRIWVWK